MEISVIGVGNLLMKDDGIGIHVVEELRKRDLPPNVEVYDAATHAFAVLEFMERKDKAILIDACKRGGSPGSIYRFSFHPLREAPPESLHLSLHDFSFVDALRSGEGIYEYPPEIVLIGVEPRELGLGVGLSPELERALPALVEKVSREWK
jgi:hydrogenase maturation protease